MARGKPVVGVVFAILALLMVPVAVAATSGASGSSGLGRSASANRATARSDATRLLGTIQLPPGTTRSATEPSGDQGSLSGPGSEPATPNFVDAHAWWTTSADAQTIVAYVGAHLPPGAKISTTGFGGGPAGTVLTASVGWTLPPIPGVLTTRTISVRVAALDGTVIGVRTDGEAVWQTPRPAWEVVPAAARTTILTAHGADMHTGAPEPTSAPVTLTAAQTRKLVAFINAAEIVQPGVSACPAGFDESLTLVFRDASGKVLARAVESPSGCASIALTVGDRIGPALTDYPSVTDELVRIGAIPVCTGAQLTASATPSAGNGDASARVVAFQFLNSSRSLCTLAGFPHLQLFDAAGDRLHVTLTDASAGIVRRQGVEATSVLDPHTAAGFEASFTVCAAAPAATRARVTLPGIAKPFTLAVGWPSERFAPCNGAVGVGDLGQAG